MDPAVSIVGLVEGRSAQGFVGETFGGKLAAFAAFVTFAQLAGPDKFENNSEDNSLRHTLDDRQCPNLDGNKPNFGLVGLPVAGRGNRNT